MRWKFPWGEPQKETGKRDYHDVKHCIAVVHVDEPAVGFLARPARRTAGFWVQCFGVGASFRVQEAAQEGGGAAVSTARDWFAGGLGFRV